ncbi:hypothetical protein ACIRRH_41440 [Kitasatospora sp. NPDC101235]|uniref:hypothetical protein n=1 Tax=Kitasatospora sp. NPDC101235 TaxID=3364101 RepID=UPI003809588A
MPLLLVEAGRENESTGTLVDKPTAYPAGRREKEREEYERRGPACTRCSVKFAHEQRAEKERAWNDGVLRAGCCRAAAGQGVWEETERERAVAEAAAAEVKRRGSWWRRVGLRRAAMRREVRWAVRLCPVRRGAPDRARERDVVSSA